MSVVCCYVEVSGSDWSPVQRSPTECVVSNEGDREASIMRRLKPIGSCCAREINLLVAVLHGLWLFASLVNHYSYHTLLVTLYEAV